MTPSLKLASGLFFCHLTVLCAQMGGAAPILDLPPEILTISTLGYPQPIVLKGIDPEFALSFPAPVGGLDVAQSFVQLKLDPSPTLHEDSTVRLIANGHPIAIMTVKSLRINPVVKVFLPELPPGEPFIHFAIQPYLYSSHDYCHDLATGNLFLTLDQHSFFHLQPRYADESILDFLRPSYRSMSFVVPPALDPHQTEATLWLYSILTYHLRDRQIPIFWQPGRLAEPAHTPQVIVDTSQEGADVERRGFQLRVRATANAVQTLATALETPSPTPNFQPALVSRELHVEAINASWPRPLGDRRVFRELGLDDRTVRGPGTQTLRLVFSLAQLGGRPKDLAVVLKAAFSPVAQAQGDRLHAQVYFNNTLVQTFDLTGRTSLKETLWLPNSHVHRTNNLDIQFSYLLAAGNCQARPTGFIAQVHGDSYLTWNGHQGPDGDFADLPHVFLGEGQVIAEGGRPTLLAAAGYLLGVISRLGRQPVLPEYVAADSIQDWASVPTKRATAAPAWRLIAVSPSQAVIPAPVRLNDGFEIYNPVNRHQLLKARPADPIGLLQYFTWHGVPTLWLSWWGAEDSLAASLAQALADPRTSLANQIKGNVVTATNAVSHHHDGTAPVLPPTEPVMMTGTSAVRLQSWDLRGTTLDVAYPDDLDWEILLRRYRSLIIALVVVLGGLLAWRLYRRLGRPPVISTAEPRAPETEETR